MHAFYEGARPLKADKSLRDLLLFLSFARLSRIAVSIRDSYATSVAQPVKISGVPRVKILFPIRRIYSLLVDTNRVCQTGGHTAAKQTFRATR